MLTSAQNEYSNLRDESTENTRSRLASIGLTADLAALTAINICFVTLGALLYSALRRLGSTVSRMQRYIVTIGAVFFVALLLRSVYAPHQPAAENSAPCMQPLCCALFRLTTRAATLVFVLLPWHFLRDVDSPAYLL